ncbi:hypothetical protein [Halobellus rarus]|uniref:Uncharacterized protein n=1 Tax=Halobellus rarus TaxID=1126237 RepID=A0ABD6CND3_9EURY|nr:hypothetical protein [Halobellus rarus]
MAESDRLSRIPTKFLSDPRGYILGIIREWIVGLVLSAGALYAAWIDQIGDIGVRTFQQGFLGPIVEALMIPGAAVLDSFEGIQASVAESLVGLGVAAPFALVIGFAVAMVVFVVLFGLLWSLIDTYLPAGALTAPIRALVSLFSFQWLRRGDGSTSDSSGGESNDQ